MALDECDECPGIEAAHSVPSQTVFRTGALLVTRSYSYVVCHWLLWCYVQKRPRRNLITV